MRSVVVSGVGRVLATETLSPPARPPAADGGMLAFGLRRRDAKESATAIATHLGVGRSPLYRTLAAYDEKPPPPPPAPVREVVWVS
ncbi:hypothetical protein ACFRJ1_07125 [Streptomyces sp. NPDC056773]|uniref:hypothetical protein n=1 Tax=unclassified Streptomyces TaxID=2593676 RepID=UPI0036790A27